MAKEIVKGGENVNLNDSLKKLGEIVSWFEKQDEIDVEKGLENVREGVALIKSCKTRLTDIENEFKTIQREISDEDEGDALPTPTHMKKVEKEDDVEDIDPDNIPF